MNGNKVSDKLIHPALLDPRAWADVNLYDATACVDREEVQGEVHHTPDRRFIIHRLKLELQIDDQKRSVAGTATFTLSPVNDGVSYFELDAAEMQISGVKLLGVKEHGAGDLARPTAHAAKRLDF